VFALDETREPSMNANQPECWSTEPHARGLRVEVAADHSFILPFDQFIFAELTVHDGEQVLKLAFATHEVVLRGRALRRLETAIQRMDLAHVVALPEHYGAAIPDGQPLIRELAVAEVDSGREAASREPDATSSPK
jgi:hypothetical protein